MGVRENKKDEVERKSVEDVCRDCWRCGIRFQLRAGLGWVRREGVTVICRATRNGLSVVANAASLSPNVSRLTLTSDAHAHALAAVLVAGN